MSEDGVPPAAAARPRRPLGSGDEWVELADGRRFWGRYGAAGLLLRHAERGVLLQHRVQWSHYGGTWGLPGGALHEHETAVSGAVREAAEEAGVPGDSVLPLFSSVLDLGEWTYTTVAAAALRYFDPVIGDAESIGLRWVPDDQVQDLPLHPGFAASWPMLLAELDRPVQILVDGANVIGSRPDGWWKDRPAAAERLGASLRSLATVGVLSADLPFSVIEQSDATQLDRRWPLFVLVLEGEARSANPQETESVEIVRARADGDSAIVELVQRARVGTRSIVVTADRELRERVAAGGGSTVSPGWLIRAIGALG